MNLLHLRYAVEVAKEGSVSKAAETLFIAPPNLSRSIKELEADIGISIFERTSRGMILTHDGEEFIGYAKAILSRIDDLENVYRSRGPKTLKFSASVPRATYVSSAFAKFTQKLPESAIEIFYKETGSSETIKNLLYEDYKLGIMRYADHYTRYFESMFSEKGLESELIAEYRSVLIMRRDSPLARLPELHFGDLSNMLEIVHTDPYVPSIPTTQVKNDDLVANRGRLIFIYERASQFDLLSENPDAFMWVAPIPQNTLDRYGLVQRECAECRRIYKDVLIYKKGYKLSALDRSFIDEVKKARDTHLYPYLTEK